MTADAEVFAFATDPDPADPVLRAPLGRRRDGAGRRVEVTDRFGGTRIATNLRTLLRSRHGNLLRGAVVLIASDGWDSDPPEQLAAAMARLRRRAHRVLGSTPAAPAPGFEPRVGVAWPPRCRTATGCCRADTVRGPARRRRRRRGAA